VGAPLSGSPPKWEPPKWEPPKWEAPKWEAPKWEAPKWEAPEWDVFTRDSFLERQLFGETSSVRDGTEMDFDEGDEKTPPSRYLKSPRPLLSESTTACKHHSLGAPLLGSRTCIARRWPVSLSGVPYHPVLSRSSAVARALTGLESEPRLSKLQRRILRALRLTGRPVSFKAQRALTFFPPFPRREPT